MTDLTWHRTSNGTYVAAVPTGQQYVDRSWHIWKRDRRWFIESVTVTRQAVPHSLALPPVSVETLHHGHAYTLREAKESVTL